MSKKLIAFDLDETLAESKSAITDEMSELLGRLLDKYQVCVISGGKFEQFEKQLVANLKVNEKLLKKIHMMPTCGTRYYTYSEAKNNWQLEYAEDFSDKEKERIIKALREGIQLLGYEEKQTWGDTIEDRGSQITFSALGQDIVEQLGEKGAALKKAWDPDSHKKRKLRDYLAPLLPEFEVRVGGTTSIDITKLGIDKAYGMTKIIETLKLEMSDVLFIGDRLEEGGNDYPVKAMGVDSIAVVDHHETPLVIKGILSVS